MLDATQKRELGRLRERPRAKHNGGRRAVKRSAAGRDDRGRARAARRDRAGRSSWRAWPERCGAGGSSWRCSRACWWRGGCWPGALGAVRRCAAGRVGARGGAGVAAGARAAGADAAGAAAAARGSGADGSTLACRPCALGRLRRVPAGELAAIRRRVGRVDRGPRRAPGAAGGVDRAARAARHARPRGRLARHGDVRAPRPARGHELGAVAARAAPSGCRCGSRSRSASTSSARSSRSSCRSATCCWAASPARASAPRCRLVVATAALDPSRAAVAARRQAGRAVGVGAVRAAARGPGRRRGDRAAARAARGDGGALPRAARPRRAQGQPRATGCRCTWWRATSWRSTSAPRTASSSSEFAELLRDLVARGRAAGVIVCAATQKPASDVVPSALRDLFGFRLALRCNTPQASDTILGQGWATLGHSAATIAPGQRGVGLLLAEDGTPGADARLSPRRRRRRRRSPTRARALRADALARRGRSGAMNAPRAAPPRGGSRPCDRRRASCSSRAGRLVLWLAVAVVLVRGLARDR